MDDELGAREPRARRLLVLGGGEGRRRPRSDREPERDEVGREPVAAPCAASRRPRRGTPSASLSRGPLGFACGDGFSAPRRSWSISQITVESRSTLSRKAGESVSSSLPIGSSSAATKKSKALVRSERPGQLLVGDVVQAGPEDPRALVHAQPGVAVAFAEGLELSLAVVRALVAARAQRQEQRGVLDAIPDHRVEQRRLVELRVAPDLDLARASAALVQLDRQLLVEALDPPLEVVDVGVADEDVPLHIGIGHKRHTALLGQTPTRSKAVVLQHIHKLTTK